MNAVPIALSFDVEEHFRIEAAAQVPCSGELRDQYAARMDESTRWLLDLLARRQVLATFFVVGEIARSHPELIRAMIEGGHEVASHSWDHRRVHHFNPQSFREDVRTSKDALEQASGAAVAGFRAPTFSIMHETSWAIDVLAELGMRYDSSIFPVRHDRYGVPDAPRTPFLVRGTNSELLELPPVTTRLLNMNVPVGGGGYFRLFPRFLLEQGLRQLAEAPINASVVYFHPWEFDPSQPRLPLGRVSRFRTYVGINENRDRFDNLLGRHQFGRMIDSVSYLEARLAELPRFALAGAA